MERLVGSEPDDNYAEERLEMTEGAAALGL
jgi:hypothetical protein